MKVEDWPTERVKPYPGNPRRNDTAVDAVAASIREFGFRQPIVVDKDGVIVVGHTRWKAAQKLGLEAVPVHVAEGLSAEQARAYRLADNSTRDLSDWDMGLLAGEVASLEGLGFELEAFGIKVDKLALEAESAAEALMDQADKLNEIWAVKPGDLWQIGKHRLLCSDARYPESYYSVLEGQKATLLFTSPPYDNAEVYEQGESRQDYKALIAGCALCWSQAIQAGGIVAVNIGNRVGAWNSGLWTNALLNRGLTFVRRIVWKKPEGVGIPSEATMQRYGWGLQYTPRMITEDLLFFARDMPNGISDKADDIVVLSNGRPRAPDRKRHLDRALAWKFFTDVWEILPVRSDLEQGHPAAFPLQLPENVVTFYSLDDEVIIEPFAGSGTTIVACENKGRVCRAIEIEPKYCAIALQRMADAFPGIEIQRA